MRNIFVRIKTTTLFKSYGYLHTFLFLLFAVSAKPNTTRQSIDSLRLAYVNGASIEHKVKSALELSAHYNEFFHNGDSGLMYASYALKQTGKHESQEAAEAYLNIARAYNEKHSPEKAFAYLDTAYKLSRKIHYTYGQYRAMYFKSMLFGQINEPDSSLKFLEDALSLNRVNGNQSDLAGILNELGKFYFDRKDYKTALQFHFESYHIWNKITVHNTAGVLSDIGNCYYYMGEYDSALYYYKQSHEINKENHYAIGLGYSLNNIGLVFFKKGEYAKALKNFNASLDNYQKEGSIEGIANSLDNICKLYIEKGDYSKALHTAEKALPFAMKFKENKGLIYNIYSDFADIYARQKNYEKAFIYQQILTAYRDSIYGSIKANADAALKAHITIMQKDAENNLLVDSNNKQENQLKNKTLFSVIIGLFLLLAIFALIMVWRNTRQRTSALKMLTKQHEVIDQKNRELDDLNKVLTNQKDQLEDVNNFKDKLFSIISHDFRSPLVSLNSYLQFLNEDEIPPEEAGHLRKEMIERVNLTLNFVDNLIEWAQSQIYGTQNPSERLVARKTTDEMVELYKHQAESKGVKIINSISETLVLNTNAGLVKMVLRNLISNAIKYSSLNDKITIYSEVQKEKSIISVQDTGSGMSEEILHKLFTGYIPSQPGTSWEKGSGLGLVLCKEFLEKYGGNIWAISTKGKGSTFSFSIPNESIEDKIMAEASLIINKF